MHTRQNAIDLIIVLLAAETGGAIVWKLGFAIGMIFIIISAGGVAALFVLSLFLPSEKPAEEVQPQPDIRPDDMPMP